MSEQHTGIRMSIEIDSIDWPQIRVTKLYELYSSDIAVWGTVRGLILSYQICSRFRLIVRQMCTVLKCCVVYMLLQTAHALQHVSV